MGLQQCFQVWASNAQLEIDAADSPSGLRNATAPMPIALSATAYKIGETVPRVKQIVSG
jgi:hypothetical protein